MITIKSSHEIDGMDAAMNIVTSCISMNVVEVQGISSMIQPMAGDIVSVDIGACYHGYQCDSTTIYAVENIRYKTVQPIEIGETDEFEGLKCAKSGNHVTDISHEIGKNVNHHNDFHLHEFSGHGVGTSIYEGPSVPNFGQPNCYVLTRTVEPMLHCGRPPTNVQ